jgi:hypothetical protein
VNGNESCVCCALLEWWTQAAQFLSRLTRPAISEVRRRPVFIPKNNAIACLTVR